MPSVCSGRAAPCSCLLYTSRIPPPYTEDGSLILESLRRRLGAADKTIPAIQLDNDLSATMLRYLRLQEQKQQVETQAKTLDTEMQRLKGQMVARCV